MSAPRGTAAQSGGRAGAYALATVFMLVGSTLVLGTVVTMNELSAPPERKELERQTELEVVKQPKPKPKQEVRRAKPKPRRSPKAPPRPALANMGSNLAGIAFDLPGLQFEDLGGESAELLQTGDDVVHTSDTVDTKPQPVQQIPATYPKRAKDRGLEGFVNISFLLDKNGNVTQMRVIESKPPDVFDDAAEEALRQWRYTPAMYKGEAVSGWFKQKIVFRLARR